jgi:hypothetical protein
MSQDSQQARISRRTHIRRVAKLLLDEFDSYCEYTLITSYVAKMIAELPRLIRTGGGGSVHAIVLTPNEAARPLCQPPSRATALDHQPYLRPCSP